MFNEQSIHNDLKNMGILPSDNVLIHISMKAVGEVEGGADGLIDALCSYLSEGILFIPTHTWDTINDNQPVYDVQKEVPCIGIVPQKAAFRKDGYRSLHPTHSIWGHGTNAKEFLLNEEKACSPSPVGFAWSRLPEINTKILLIGVGHNRNTFIHAIDEMVDLPNRLHPKAFETTIIDYDGTIYHSNFHCHYCTKSNDVSMFFVNFEKPLIELGAQKQGKLGNADVKIIDSVKCRDIILKIYENAKEDLCLKYMDIPEAYYK